MADDPVLHPVEAPGGDWPARVADTIEGAVTAVHDRVVRPVLVVIRVLVFGVLVAIMSTVLVVLLTIAAVRAMTDYLYGGRVWLADFTLAVVFCAAGAALWAARNPRGESDG